MSMDKDFRIEWDLHELGPKAPEAAPQPDWNARLDFTRLDLGRALAAGYVPANAALPKDQAA